MITRSLSLTRGILALSLLMALALFPTTSSAEDKAQDPTGTWDIAIDMAGQELPASITITKNEDGTYNGSLTSAMGDVDFDSVSFSGSDLAFTQTLGEGDSAMEFTFNGKLDGDTFMGILNSDMGEMPVKGKRANASGPLFGTWNLEASSEAGEFKYPFVLNPDLTGTLGGQAFTNLSLKQKSLSFDITLPVEGENMDFEIELTFKKGELSGEAFADGESVADISGTFGTADTTSKAKGHFGTWDIESSSEEGTKKHVMVLSNDMTATVDGAEVKDLVLTAKGIKYSMSIPVEGSSMDIEIEITIEGDKLNGEAYANGETVADLSGKRAA